MLLAHVDNAFLELIDDTSSISQESGDWRVVEKSRQWVFNKNNNFESLFDSITPKNNIKT